MAFRILISGMNPFDSGKTSLAIQLGSWLKSSGHKVEYFKPTSGHNYWYRYSHTLHCLRLGQLVSYDATRFVEAVGSALPMPTINPVHSLFIPGRLDSRGRSVFSTLGLAGWDSHLALQRFSHPIADGTESTILAARELLEGRRLVANWAELQSLLADCKVIPIRELDDAQEYEQDNLEECLDKSFTRVEQSCNTTIIESFNDSAWPWRGLQKVDLVLVVGPGHVLEYDPAKFRQSAEMAVRDGADIRGATFSAVAELLRPRRIHELRPEVGLDANSLTDMTRTVK